MSDARIAASAILDHFKPSLMVCATDNIALGVINAAYSRGIVIPSDLSVTGFGGYDITEVIHPALTTVQYPYMEAGRVAAQNIMRLVEHKSVEKVTVMNYSLSKEKALTNAEQVDYNFFETGSIAFGHKWNRLQIHG